MRSVSGCVIWIMTSIPQAFAFTPPPDVVWLYDRITITMQSSVFKLHSTWSHCCILPSKWMKMLYIMMWQHGKATEIQVVLHLKIYIYIAFVFSGNDNLTHEDLARCFCELPPILVGLPSIFLYMACSTPLCSECFFTSLDSSAWIVCTGETRQMGLQCNTQTSLLFTNPALWEIIHLNNIPWLSSLLTGMYPYINTHKWSPSGKKLH